MINYLPEIYPDELVYSWFCRYHIYSGNLSHKQSLQDLYCKKSDTPIKEFIGNLNPEARDCINRTYPLKEIVLNQTMYPQYARFIPLEQKKDALYKLCNENCDIHHLFAVPPRCEKEQYLKYCPVCARGDRQKYGETYWHRKHQIRNIGICPKHKCKLQDSSVSAKSMNIYNFSAAEIVIPNTKEYIAVDNPLQIRFAEFTEQIFDAPVNFERDVPLSAVLYHAMKKTKYMKSTGNCRYMTKFVSDMTRFYEQIELNEIASIGRIQRTLLSSEKYDFSLVCQIGFFLNMASEELTNPQLSEEQIKVEDESHYIKGNVAPNWKEYDSQIAMQLQQYFDRAYNNVNQKPIKITEGFLRKTFNIKQHQLENMPKCRAILERYQESYPEFWARKIIWAYHLLEHHDKIYWCDIRKLSGVKREQALQAIPFLREYPYLIDLIQKS